MSQDRDQIRTLNDELRQHLLGGGAVVTPGITALGPAAVNQLLKIISMFNQFCEENDPHGEHDFGAFAFEQVDIIFKIDYYDKSLRFQSPDPGDPAVTERIITIMLADEY